ncbi:MAG: Superfamily helicase protein [Lachnospiraceae bacterium]|nr:Superfamily helicase protein [Lachnospiraceae bacterium]
MLEINSLTAETILEDDIFCEIFEQEDEIYKARLLLTLTDRAADLGVKTKFEKLVSAYKKAKAKFDKDNKQAPLNQVEHDSMTHFTGPYQDLNCGMWIANNNGIKAFTYLGEKVACTHPIMPIQVLTNAETGYVKVKLAFKLRDKWKEIIIDNEVISIANKITSLSKYGIDVTSETAKALVQYLSDMKSYNTNSIAEQISTSKLGWINNVFMPYDADVLFDGDDNFKSTFASITETGSYEKWLGLVRKLRKSNRMEIMLYLAGSFSSPLLQKLNALPFIVNLYGETGKGKTVALEVATSIWANPEEGKYFVKANGSPASIEIRLDFLNNLPLLVDDLSQIQKKLKDDFSEYVYNLCNGGGKDRATATLGLQRQRYWKNVIITNSERSLVGETMQGGAINRIIEVEMEEGNLFESGNEVVELIKNNYGFAGRIFIDVINQIGIKQIKAIQQEFFQQILEKTKQLGDEKEEKQILPMSILLTADKIATDYIFEDGLYLDIDKCFSLLKSKGEVSENERAYDFIMSDINIHTNNFVPDLYGNYKGEVWGTIEDGYAIIHNNIFKGMCDRGNFSGKSFLSWADKNGLLKYGTSTKVKKLAGKSSRCVYIKMDSDNPGTVETDQDGFIKINEQVELPFN